MTASFFLGLFVVGFSNDQLSLKIAAAAAEKNLKKEGNKKKVEIIEIKGSHVEQKKKESYS